MSVAESTPAAALARPLFLRPTSELLAFLVLAIRQQRLVYARNGISAPEDLDSLMATLTSAATDRQSPPPAAARSTGEQVGVVAPRLVSYDVAAAVLGISKRSLERQIAAGELNPVRVGGAALIRVAQLDEYIAALVAEQEKS